VCPPSLHPLHRSHFSAFGELEATQVLLNVDTRRSRGFGFVVFRDDASVERCIAASSQTPDGKLRQVRAPRTRVCMLRGWGLTT